MGRRSRLARCLGRAGAEDMTEALSIDFVDQLCRTYRNWGRWGIDDELGTINFIDSAKRVPRRSWCAMGEWCRARCPTTIKARRQVPLGARTSFTSCYRTAATSRLVLRTPSASCAIRTTPYTCRCRPEPNGMLSLISSTMVDVQRLHVGLRNERGATRGSIDKLSAHVVTRGVLLDIPRFLGVDSLPAGYGITSAELEGCATAEGSRSEEWETLFSFARARSRNVDRGEVGGLLPWASAGTGSR